MRKERGKRSKTDSNIDLSTKKLNYLTSLSLSLILTSLQVSAQQFENIFFLFPVFVYSVVTSSVLLLLQQSKFFFSFSFFRSKFSLAQSCSRYLLSSCARVVLNCWINYFRLRFYWKNKNHKYVHFRLV